MATDEMERAPDHGLSPQQARLWRARDETPLLAELTADIRGPLDLPRLERAVARVVARHAILRATFVQPSGVPTPVQRAGDPGACEIPIHDLGSLSPATRQEHLDRLSQQLAGTAWDLASGPPLRLSVARLGTTDHVLLVALPAMCADATTLELLVREVADAYTAESGPPDEGSPLQYAEVAAWERELREGSEGTEGRAFWERPEILAPGRARLPFERLVGSAPVATGETRVALDPDTGAALAALAQRAGVPANRGLLAAYAVLLWRLVGGDVVVGIGHDGRTYDELGGVLGPLARSLPVVVAPDPSATFEEVLAQVHAASEQAPAWHECHTWDRVGDVGGDAFPSYGFDVEPPLGRYSAGPLTLDVTRRRSARAGFRLRLTCVPRGAGWEAVFHYDPDIFDADVVEGLARRFATVLGRLVRQPGTRVAEVNVLTDDEWERLVVGLNATRAEYPADRCMHDLFEEQVRRTPDRVAVVFGEQRVTYRELSARANQLARALRRLGVGPEIPVVLCLSRSVEMLVGIWGVLKAGGAYVPLDPAYPRDRLELVLADTQAPVLLTQERLAGVLPPHRGRVLCLDRDWAAIAAESSDDVRTDVRPEHLVYVIYTSGSTGRPKGVMISHRTLVASNTARIAYYGRDVDTFLLLSPVAFDSSVVGIFWTLCVGGTLLLVPDDVQRNLELLTATMGREGVSHLLTLPSFYALILEHAAAHQLAPLRAAIVAGEACPPQLIERHRARLPAAGMFNEYGPTESTVWSSVADCLTQRLQGASLGRPIDNVTLYLLDVHGQPVPPMVPGELYIGGETLARGYLNRPDLTAERFVPDPFAGQAGARLYRSGDLARHVPDGEIEFLGRADNQVKIRGFRVELEEIEAALVQHPDVRECAVVARADANERGPAAPSSDPAPAASKRLVAYVVSSRDGEPDVSDVRRFLGARLPEYMIPARFVALASLPRTPNGKIDRRALPAPTGVRADGEPMAEPTAPAERVLAQVWSEILQVPVGVDDNFFELGGDSILSIQVVARARRAGLHFTVRDLFEHQTIAALARVAAVSGWVEAEQGLVSGPVALTPIQRWFFEQDPPDPAHANMSVLLESDEGLDATRLQAALEQLVRHHDALRLRFQRGPDGWVQENMAGAAAVPVARHDLAGIPEGARDGAIERAAARVQTALDLEKGPLLAAALFDRGTGRGSDVLLAAHHLAVDGVSWRILLEDLETAYRALGQGQPAPLPAKTTSFKEWATRLAEHAGSEGLRAELGYWLADHRAQATPLPVDFPEARRRNTFGAARTVTVSLSAEETRALLHEVPRTHEATVDDVLLTGLVLAIAEWADTESVLVDLEGHGREEIVEGVDLSRTVGWFTTVFPVLFRLDARGRPLETLSRIAAQRRAIPARGIGYGLLRYLGQDRDVTARLRALPPAEINFNNLGQYDQGRGAAPLVRSRRTSCGPDTSPRRHRPHLLEVVSAVIGGRLSVDWAYGAEVHREATVAGLVERFARVVRTIIGSGGPVAARVPAEVAEFGWSAADVAKITGAIRRAQGR